MICLNLHLSFTDYILFQNCIETIRKINNVYMERCDVVAHAGKVDVNVRVEEQLVHDLVDEEKLSFVECVG